MIIVAATAWLVFALLLVASAFGFPRRVPVPYRPALRWLLTAALLIETAALAGLSHRHHRVRFHHLIGVVVLGLALASLACLAIAFISLRRQRHWDEQTTPPHAAPYP